VPSGGKTHYATRLAVTTYDRFHPGTEDLPFYLGCEDKSSFAMKGDEEKARAAACDDYVTKPLQPSPAVAYHLQLSR
jgi:hypothetical protein